MRMLLSNQTAYYRGYGKTVQTQRNADWAVKMTGKILAFAPVLWILFFALLTGIVKLLAK